MSAESILYGILSTAPGITALVGTRIYPDIVPESKASPYIGFERVSTSPINTIHGTTLAEDVGMVVACWADTRLAADGLADAVESAMQSAGHLYTARGAEYDDSTGRASATLDYTILVQ